MQKHLCCLRSFFQISILFIFSYSCYGEGKTVKHWTHDSPENNPTAGWTIMIYSMADCNLEEPMMEDLVEMAEAGSNENVNIVILCDRAKGYTNKGVLNLPNWTTAKYLLANKGEFKEIQDLGELDMGDPNNVINFIEWGVKNFPAKRYALIFSDHGGAWPGFGGDESTENDDYLDLNKFKHALKEGLHRANLQKFSLIGFDACLMQTFETELAFKPFTDYFLASEETEPSHGWDYRRLSILRDNPDTDPEELGKSLIDGFVKEAIENEDVNEITLSLINLKKLDKIESALNDFVLNVKERIRDFGPMIGKAYEKTNAYGRSPDPEGCVNTIDLGQFASALSKKYPDLSSVADKIQKSIEESVLYKQNGKGQKGSSGIAIYFPPLKKYYEEPYNEISESGVWKDFLNAYYSGGKALPKEEQAELTNENDMGDIKIDENNEISLTGNVLNSCLNNIVDITLEFGLVDPETKEIFVIGDANGEIIDDGKATGSFPPEIMFIKTGNKKSYGYISYKVEDDLIEMTMPFHYYAPGSKKPENAFAFISGNPNDDEEKWEQIFFVESENGTYGELEPEEGSKLVPLILKLPKADYEIQDNEWIETVPVSFNKKGDLDIDFEKLSGNETIYLQLLVEDYGGNEDFVYYEGPIPKK